MFCFCATCGLKTPKQITVTFSGVQNGPSIPPGSPCDCTVLNGTHDLAWAGGLGLCAWSKMLDTCDPLPPQHYYLGYHLQNGQNALLNWDVLDAEYAAASSVCHGDVVVFNESGDICIVPGQVTVHMGTPMNAYPDGWTCFKCKLSRPEVPTVPVCICPCDCGCSHGGGGSPGGGGTRSPKKSASFPSALPRARSRSRRPTWRAEASARSGGIRVASPAA